MTQSTVRTVGPIVAVVFSCVASAQSTPAVEWKVSDGGNGHWYEAVHATPSLSPEAWFTWAGGHGGVMASITSAAEQAIIMTIATQNGDFTQAVIGGKRNSSNQFQWVSGEPWSFVAWSQGEPSCTCEKYLMLYASGWNDTNSTARPWGIAEYSADCNNDGLVDFGQIRAGTLIDQNANNVPDCCEGGPPCPQPLLVPEQYSTIQAAVDAALAGDTVLVAAGVYVESVNLRGKAITVTSAVPGGATVSAPEGERSFVATSGETESTKLVGFRVTRSGATGGGVLTSGASPRIEDCVFETYGITALQWTCRARARDAGKANSYQWRKCCSDFVSNNL